MSEQTFAMVKPDAFALKVVGRVLSRIEGEGFTLVQVRLKVLTWDEAERFYAEHVARPFFRSLVEFMVSGPVLALLLERGVYEMPGVLVYGATPDEVRAKVKAIALRAIADRLEHGEVLPDTTRFVAALRVVNLPASLANAPIDDEPETFEEIAAVAQARTEVARGETMTTDELLRSLGL